MVSLHASMGYIESATILKAHKIQDALKVSNFKATLMQQVRATREQHQRATLKSTLAQTLNRI